MSNKYAFYPAVSDLVFIQTSYPTVMKGPPGVQWGHFKVVPSEVGEYENETMS